VPEGGGAGGRPEGIWASAAAVFFWLRLLLEMQTQMMIETTMMKKPTCGKIRGKR